MIIRKSGPKSATVGLPVDNPGYLEKWGDHVVELLRDGWSLRCVNFNMRTPWGIGK